MVPVKRAGQDACEREVALGDDGAADKIRSHDAKYVVRAPASNGPTRLCTAISRSAFDSLLDRDLAERGQVQSSPRVGLRRVNETSLAAGDRPPGTHSRPETCYGAPHWRWVSPASLDRKMNHSPVVKR
jgi:hypothetical protein